MNRRVVALPLDQSVTWDAQEDRAGKEVECGVYLRGVQKVGVVWERKESQRCFFHSFSCPLLLASCPLCSIEFTRSATTVTRRLTARLCMCVLV